MNDPLVSKRLVFHFAGYDPKPPEAVHRRFVRELRRFEATWSTRCSVSPPEIDAVQATWSVVTSGRNWRVETEIRLVRWDDLIEAGRPPSWARLPLGLLAFVDFAARGALLGYLRTNWRYAAFFLYPFALLLGFATLALLAWRVVAGASGSEIAGIVAGVAAMLALLRWPGRGLGLLDLLDDWIFARRYIRSPDPVLDQRLDQIARSLREAARRPDLDEILVVGHSLGAVLAVDLLARAVRAEPRLGQEGAEVTFLAVASSILKIGLHRDAGRFRDAVGRVASAPGLFWAEYQSLTDVMNFYRTDPTVALRVGGRRPLVRGVRIRRMLDPAAYRRIRRNFFRVHCQFVSGNTVRAPYDYFMFLCGPLSARSQAQSVRGAMSAFGEDDALLGGASPEVEPGSLRAEAARR